LSLFLLQLLLAVKKIGAAVFFNRSSSYDSSGSNETSKTLLQNIA
jgi:hypothetical protein